MDARMPEMNGLEATNKIRKITDIEKSKTPVIALTAAVTKEDRIAYQKAGMDGFLAKPFKENELLLEINKVLHLNTEENKKPVKVKEKKQEESGIDFTDLKKLSAGDEKFYIDMLQTFIETTKEAFKGMQNAMEVDDWEIVAEYAHKASSPCKHLSANVLYEHLKKIEMNCRNNKEIDKTPEIIKLAKKEFEIITVKVKQELDNCLSKNNNGK